MCGLGFLGLLLAFFYVLVMIALLGWLAWNGARRAAEWMEERISGASSERSQRTGKKEESQNESKEVSGT
jgi:hypothetical protein